MSFAHKPTYELYSYTSNCSTEFCYLRMLERMSEIEQIFDSHTIDKNHTTIANHMKFKLQVSKSRHHRHFTAQYSVKTVKDGVTKIKSLLKNHLDLLEFCFSFFVAVVLVWM